MLLPVANSGKLDMQNCSYFGCYELIASFEKATADMFEFGIANPKQELW